MDARRLSFAKFVQIVAEARDASPDGVEPTISQSLAEAALAAAFPGPDEIVLYPDPVEQGFLCCAEVIRRRPLAHDNKRVGFACMEEMLFWTPYRWPSHIPEEEVEEKLDGVGDGTVNDGELFLWARGRLGLAAWLAYERQRETTA
jgi:hypothetical protein